MVNSHGTSFVHEWFSCLWMNTISTLALLLDLSTDDSQIESGIVHFHHDFIFESCSLPFCYFEFQTKSKMRTLKKLQFLEMCETRKSSWRPRKTAIFGISACKKHEIFQKWKSRKSSWHRRKSAKIVVFLNNWWIFVGLSRRAIFEGCLTRNARFSRKR